MRRLFTLASALSLALFVAIGALWVRSYWVGDALSRSASGRSIVLASHGGAILYYDQASPRLFPSDIATAPAQWSYTRLSSAARPNIGDESWFNRFGIDVSWRQQFPMMAFSDKPLFETITRIVVPHWLAAMPFGVAPLIWLGQRIRYYRKRTNRGGCPACGYDLRATPDRCPECGTLVAAITAVQCGQEP